MLTKSSFLVLLFGLLGIHMHAQIIITENDMPNAGDMIPFTITTALPDGLDPSLTGEGMIWDYSELAPGFDGVDTFYTVGQTPFLFQFFFNNGLLFPDHQADHARKEMSVNLGLVNITNAYSYFKNDSEGYRNVGFGANVNGLPSSVRNEPIDWIYEFPLAFGNESSSPSASELEIPTLGYYNHEQEREVLVEGWGTLILPGGSYEVLKVKMIVNATDSVYIESLGTGFPFVQPEETIYQWLAIGQGEPLLQISQQVGFGYTIRYRYDAAVSLEEVDDIEFNIYPNPATDRITVKSAEQSVTRYVILDTNGHLVSQRSLDENELEIDIPVQNLSKGTYVLMLEVEGTLYYSTFCKE